MVNEAGLQDLVMVDRVKLLGAIKATMAAASSAKQAASLCNSARQSFLSEAERLDLISEALRAAM